MTVSKEIARLPRSRVRVTLKVGKDDVRACYDGIVADYAKTLQIPGFRKGKAPESVLVRKFGEALRGAALQKLVEDAVEAALGDEALPKEERPLPYSTPALEGEPALDIEKDFSFAVAYDVLPKVKPGAWKGLEIEVPAVSVDTEDISRELEAIRERNAVVLDKGEGAKAAAGDAATVDYCELDGSGGVVPGSEREGFAFIIGSGANVFHFDEEVAGMKAGETKEFVKTWPAGEADKSLAGKTKRLRVTLRALKEKKLPALDDDLAQDVDEKFHTLKELKESVKERLERNLERRLREIKINRLLEKIMENTPVEIPESMLDVETESRWRALAQGMGIDAGGLERALDAERGPGAALAARGELRPAAERALHSRLVVEAIMGEQEATNGPAEVSDEEVEAEIERLAGENGAPLGETRKAYESPEAKAYLKDQIRERKFFDSLLAGNTVKTGGRRKYVDLFTDNG
ncbi:MAG: trigger factor [Treponematales bacterium]